MDEFRRLRRPRQEARNMSLSIPIEIHERLRPAAARHCTTMAEIARVVLAEWLARDEDKAKRQELREAK